MFGQLFGKYLVEQGVLTEDVLKSVLEEQSKIRVKLGVIAVADKLLTQEQADRLNPELIDNLVKVFNEVNSKPGKASLDQKKSSGTK